MTGEFFMNDKILRLRFWSNDEGDESIRVAI
jgi:hypothetical protein